MNEGERRLNRGGLLLFPLQFRVTGDENEQ
jgi:hypothetical protein